MPHRLRVHRTAQRDLVEVYRWALGHAPHTADAWFDRLQKAIARLERNALVYQRALEHRKATEHLRELHFGRRPNVYRVVYFATADDVHVIRVLRAQRRPLSAKEIREAIRDLGEEPPTP